jgi:hypothetical protein
MIIANLFPTSVQEREEASSTPVRFFLHGFVRFAVTVALVLAAFYVIIPSTRLASWPERLYSITTFAVLMAGFRVWAARKSHR